MRIQSPGRATTIHTIQPGTLFSAKLREGMRLCLAIEPSRPSGPPDAIVLIPGHPMVPTGPGMLSASVFGNSTVFEIESASIAFDINLQNVSTDTYNIPDNNKMIYTTDGKFYIKFSVDEYRTNIVNLETGLYEEADLSRAAVILAWRVIWTDARGVAHEIARQDCRAGEPSANR